jgi:cell division protein ZapD
MAPCGAAPARNTYLVLYEYPLSEGIRTMLRLEHLFDRLGQLLARDTVLDHHFALATLFEIMDVSARADLKSDLLKELDLQRSRIASFRGNPSIAEAALDEAIARIDNAFDGLNQMRGKAGSQLASNEWLMSIRSRIGIPGGTCEFDLPAYHAWQQRAASQRRADLMNWTGTVMPLAQALSVLLSHLRESGVPHMVAAIGGQYQHSLPTGRIYHLLRVRMDQGNGLIPEISGHRLMISIRLMRAEPDGRLKPCIDDASLELTLCS